MSFLKITDPSKRDFIVNEFLKAKRNIQQSYQSEKLGDIGLQRGLTKLYKPITDSQSTQSSALAKELSALKDSTTAALQTLPPQLRAIQFPQYPSIRAETDEEEEPKESLTRLGPIATQYLRLMAGKTSTDKTFGLYDKDGKFYIGATEVKIQDDDIIAGDDMVYDGTAGLWELITSRISDAEIYTKQDLKNYKDIIRRTNAAIDPTTGKVKSSSSVKYNTIIRPIYEEYYKSHRKTSSSSSHLSSSLRPIPATATLLPPRTGKGVEYLPSDPNALVEMLPLLMESYKAGNTGVTIALSQSVMNFRD